MAVEAPVRRRKSTGTTGKARRWWWGEGEAPHELWPGVSIRIPCQWSSARSRWETPDGRYYFDMEAADTAVDFFPALLTHHMGEFAGRPFTLLEYQIKLLTRPIFGWKRASDGLRRFRKTFDFIPKGGGKALALDTPIPTPTGWTSMGSIAVGDRVFDENGRIVDVLAVSDVMHGRPCFVVRFDDDTEITADADHLWRTEVRRVSKSQPQHGLRTTSQIRQTLRNSNGQYKSANHSIPLAGPIDTPEAVLPIDPYALGVWLGDGDSDCARITVCNADLELLDHVAAVGLNVGPKQWTSPGSAGRYQIGMTRGSNECYRGHDRDTETRNGHCRACEREIDRASRRGDPPPEPSNLPLSTVLRREGLFERKHIPEAYLRASIGQRLSLLQGLMDTDGYISPVKGQCEFCTTDPRIADGVLALLVGLGIKCSPKESAATLYGREVSRRWRLQFHPPVDLPVFRLRRKLRHQIKRHDRRSLSAERRVVDVYPIESVPVRCISVSGPSQMFLAGASMVPTHNSPWAAGTGVYLARCDGEMAAEVYALANDRNQARTVHTNAKYMVEDSPHLSEGVEITKDAIYWQDTRSTYMVLSSDASSAHGKRPHGLIFDELHGYSGDKDRELFEALRKSLIKRRQPLLIMVTHSGTDDESICFEEYEYAKALLNGSIEDDTHLPVIFEAHPDQDWQSPELHARVNPGYGITVKADAVEMECAEASNDPRKRNDFLRYHLNRWVNQATAWIPVEWWDACGQDDDQKPIPLPSDAELASLPVAAGLDLAQKIDLAALVLVFRHRIDTAIDVETVTGDEATGITTQTQQLNYRITLLPFFWIPEDTMREREKDDKVPYSQWVKAGWVTPTEGPIIDYTRIVSDITTKIVPRFPRLKQGGIGYDPAFASDIAVRLRDEHGFKAEEVLGNYKYLSEPSYLLEALIKAKRVNHGGNRALRNHVEHVAIKSDDAKRIRPVKPKRTGKHIDGVIGTLNGLRMLATVPDQPVSAVNAYF